MSATPIDRLSTRRLVLERLQAGDLDDLARMHADPQLMATLGGLRSRAESETLLRALLAHWDEHGFGIWALRDLATGRFAGRGGLRRVAVGGAEEVEVAYALLPAFWGRGLATEVARESIRVAFDALDLPDLVCFTLSSNRPSQRVMEKAGFRYERALIHAQRPHVLYRLAAPAWRSAGGA